MRKTAPLSLIVLVIGGAAVAGCEWLDPDLWHEHTGSGGSTGGTGSGGSGGGDKICGGIAAFQCGPREFCEFAVGVCNSAADHTGVCKPQADACPAVYAPVCGCDGKTYGNDCERQAAGASPLHAGACAGGSDGDVCGGIAGLACASGLFCEFDTGVCSSIADGTGLCRPRAQVCDQRFAPVCGCDGRTYGNDCERRGAGMSKLHDGPC